MAGPKYVTDFSFPSSFGFTGSASDRPTVPVRQHERQKPRFAEGGQIKKQPAPGGEPAPVPVDTGTPNPSKGKEGVPPKAPKKKSLYDIMGGKGRREAEAELGLKRGGKVRRAMGGPVKAAKGGRKSAPRGMATHEKGESVAMGRMERRMGKKMEMSHGGYAKGGDIAQDRKLVKTALNQHIRAPKPRGHGVK